MVSDLPLTVAVAVLSILPPLLVVGVVPPPFPYLPPLLLVGVVFCEVLVVEELEPELLPVLPQAAKRSMSVTATSTPGQVRDREWERKSLLCMVFFSFACAENPNENE
jgi:hypothetical protein